MHERKGGQRIHNKVLTTEDGAIQEGIVTHNAKQDAGAGSLQERGMLVVVEVISNGLHEGVTFSLVLVLELKLDGDRIFPLFFKINEDA